MRLLHPFLLSLGLIAMNSSHAADAFYTPDPGSAERRQLLDAARATVKQKIGREVQFLVKQVRVGNGWGFLRADMQDGDGRKIDYAGTLLADAAREGYVSPVYVALLRREGDGWSTVADAIGPTDVVWLAWPEKHDAPRELFED